MNQETKVLGIIGLITIVVVIAAVFMLSKQGDGKPTTVVADQSILIRDFNHKIATDSAKVTIVEFADFQCPACAAAFPLLQRIKSEYKNDLTFVYRHFPLMQHRYGRVSAKVAEAAAEQGKFWEMYEKLYLTQNEWGNSPNPQEYFDKYATELGLDVAKMKTDIDSTAIDDRINKDVSDALDLEVNSTPTLFLNGERIVGVPSYESLKSKIDTIINK